MIDYTTLVAEYWGDGHPLNWKSLDQIANEQNVTIGYLEDLMSRYSVERRLKPVEAHKIIFEVLVNQWNFEEGKDFIYKHKEGMAFCLFWIVKERIGINIDTSLNWNESRSIYVGDSEIVFLSSENFDTLRNSVVSVLNKYKVFKNTSNEAEEKDVW